MKAWIFLVALAISGPALAQQFVTANQGKPGAFGAWPVSTSSGTSSATATSSLNAKIPTAQTTTVTINATPCTAAGGASCTVIYTSTDWVQWSNVTITLSNTDGANALTNVLVEWSADNSRFEVWDSTTFAALAAGATKSIAISGNSRRYLRIEARAAATVTSAVVTITANEG